MRVERACKHCGTMIRFEKVDEPVDCSGCGKPWLVNDAGVLTKLYRPPPKKRRGSWFGGGK